jgi:periplasmic copper chaperone A
MRGRADWIAGLVGLAWAGWAIAGGVEVREAWARATMPGQQVAGVYMTLTSDVPARLVALRSPQARLAEVHEMREQDGVMRMRRVDALALPAGKAVKLEPNGLHIMLVDIREPLKPGDRARLTLVVERAGKRSEVPVDAEVRPLLPDDPHERH